MGGHDFLAGKQTGSPGDLSLLAGKEKRSPGDAGCLAGKQNGSPGDLPMLAGKQNGSRRGKTPRVTPPRPCCTACERRPMAKNVGSQSSFTLAACRRLEPRSAARTLLVEAIGGGRGGVR
jgi:hypothetical protein